MKINLNSFNPLPADINGNLQNILDVLRAPAPKADLFVFPEASLCGCPLFDLFDDKQLLAQNLAALKTLAKETKQNALLVGYIDKENKANTTAAAFIYKGKITKIFDTETVSFQGKNIQISLSAPEDTLADPDADVVLFIHATPYIKGNVQTRLQAFQKFAKKNCVLTCACNLLGGGDGLIFDGLTAVVNPKGNLAELGELFREQVLCVDTENLNKPISYTLPLEEELIQALIFGLRDYVTKSGYDKVVFGLSGGIDSAFTAFLASRALGGESVFCISLPSYCTSDLSKTLAGQLACSLGVNLEEVGVVPALDSVKVAIGHIVSHSQDNTDQGLQTHLRATILGALANEYKAMLISTDDKSELSVGSSFVHSEAGGMLQPIGDLYKSEIYNLVNYINQKEKNLIPQGIVSRAPTSELRPNQKDEDYLPPYPTLDKILQAYWEEHLTPSEIATKLHIKAELVKEVLTKLHHSDLQRRQAAPTLQVSACPLSKWLRPVIKNVNL